MKCITCGMEAYPDKPYCRECKVRVDDFLYGAEPTAKRLCLSCDRFTPVQQVNNRVIRCTFCNTRHEVGMQE